MELLIILAVAGGLIWLLSSASKKPELKHPPINEEHDNKQANLHDKK